MEYIDFDIQNNETSRHFPFRLFYNEKELAVNHCHTEIEFIFVLSNDVNIYVNGDCFRLSEGGIVMLSSGDIHGINYSSGLRMVIQFDLEMLRSLYTHNNDAEDILSRLQILERVSSEWPDDIKKRITNILLELKLAVESLTGTAYRIRIYSLLHLLVDICFNFLPEISEQGERNSLLKNKKILLNLEKLFLYIKNNYNRNITINEISAVLHYTPNYFTKLWKKYMGTSFHSYLNEYRVNQAVLLLRDTELLISDISNRTGFESIKTFNRVFKAVIGSSPSDYRKAVSSK